MKRSIIERILTLDEMVAYRKQVAKEGKRFVLTNGCFDLLHRGHLEYLEKSSCLGDVLVVAVNSDVSVKTLKGPSRPLNKEEDRAFALASLRCVDSVFIFPGPRLAAEIRKISPDVYTKAGDYNMDSLDPGEREALLSVGAEIKFLPFVEGHSTTSLIQKCFIEK